MENSNDACHIREIFCLNENALMMERRKKTEAFKELLMHTRFKCMLKIELKNSLIAYLFCI